MSMYVEDQDCVNVIEQAGNEVIRVYKAVDEEDMEDVDVIVNAATYIGILELLIAFSMTYEKYAPKSCPAFSFEGFPEAAVTPVH